VTVGGLPDVSFHDAEVLAVRVDRDLPSVELDVEVFPRTDRARTYRLRFDEVSNLELGGVNEQNALFDLTAVRGPDNWAVRVEPSYGLGGSFNCRHISSALVQ
jgi:hypothetical protein